MVISYYGQRQDTLTQQLVSIETSDIVNTVQTQGVITREVYEDFLSRLNITNMIYDIKLEHKKLAIEPEYRLKTAEEIINDQNGSYTGGNIYHYYPVSTEIPEVNDPSAGDLTMNTETNESVLARAVNTPSSGHIHTDDCYDGHKHINVYGTASRENSPVYMKYKKDYWENGSTYYNHGYFVYCAICNQPLYEFATTFSGASGYAKIYTNTSGGYQIYNFSTSYYGAPYYYHQALYNLLVAQNGNSDNGYQTYDFYWGNVWTIFNAAGNQINTPFTGCFNNLDNPSYNVTGHPNPIACYPVGKIGKVRLQVSRLSDSLTIDVYCVTCNREILRLYSKVDMDWQTNWGRSRGLSTVFYDYGSTGNIINRAGNGIASGAGGAGGMSTFTYKIDSQASAIFSDLEAKVKNLPQKTGNYWDSGNWNYVSQDIDWPFTTFPVIERVGDLAPLYWQPIRGCVYCGTYGQKYSCGQSSVIACDKKVVSIVPTHPVQAVYTNEPLITTVTATYQDGSTKVVLASTSFSTVSPVINQNVTLTYTDSLGKAQTCTINVNVIPKNKTCIHGHTYNLNNNGSDPGCPYCRAWLISLEVVDPATGIITIYRGTTLQENGVLLMATYLDGRKELLNSGYVNNLDKNYIGTQTVTISYKGKSTSLNVTVKRNIVLCPVCKRYYELFPDDTDPGCPYCASRVPVFTGNVLKYYVETFSNEILEEIYDGSGAYYFNDDDYFSISITNKDETTGTKVLRVFFRTAPKVTLNVDQGGKIRNKAAYEGEK